MPNRWQMYQSDAPQVGGGWTMETVVSPSTLFGSNGMTIGPDGGLYVTQVFGSQVTRIDVETGEHSLYAPLGGGIAGPDDCIFLADGTFYATEPLFGRVSAKSPDGSYRIVRANLPAANGITSDHSRQRLFIDEFRPGGRLLEVDPLGEHEPRVLLEELNGPNAPAMGPDGAIYFPQVFANQVWRYDLETGEARLAVDDLARPTAVKFDSRGRLVTSEAAAGRITAVDLVSGARTTLAEVPLGIDNLSLGAGDRLFVSHYVDGRVAEETPGRQRVLAEPGLLGPFHLSLGRDGALLAADGLSIAEVGASGEIRRLLRLLIDLNTLALGVCAAGEDLLVLALTGEVLRYLPGSAQPQVVASGLDSPSSMVMDGYGSVLVTERVAGRLTRVDFGGSKEVVASSLRLPGAACRDGQGNLYVSQGDSGAVLVFGADGERREIPGFGDAQGIAVSGSTLLVADVNSQELVAVDLETGTKDVAVRRAPIGQAAPGQLPVTFCSLTTDGRGGFYVGCNGDGSIRRLHRR